MIVSPANALSPLVMLATSMHAQPGVYAVLLGSGVSTGAGIPTGWGVVRELVRRVAAAVATVAVFRLWSGELEPIRFECFWIPLAAGHVLQSGQGALLGRLPT